jgi:hypothetical protein
VASFLLGQLNGASNKIFGHQIHVLQPTKSDFLQINLEAALRPVRETPACFAACGPAVYYPGAVYLFYRQAT